MSLSKIVILALFSLATVLFLLDTRRYLMEMSSMKQYSIWSDQIDEPKRYEKLKTEKFRGDQNLQQMSWIRKLNSDRLPNRTTFQTAREMCDDDSSLYCMPPKLDFEAEIRAAPKYKISTCVTQKSMSTVMTAIFCFLFKEREFVAGKRNILKEWKQLRFCANENEFWSIAKMRRRLRVRSDWKYTMVTRDPVDRFLSGFVDKCIRKPLDGQYCNGCLSNMTCFILTEYERMRGQVQNGKFWRSFEDRHFFPQNWRCNLKDYYDDYSFIRYSSDPTETLMTDLFAILRKQKVPRLSLRFLEKQLTAGRTAHSTIHSEARLFLEKRLRESPFLMEYIVRMFYHDFKMFKYSLPDGF